MGGEKDLPWNVLHRGAVPGAREKGSPFFNAVLKAVLKLAPSTEPLKLSRSERARESQ